jgi:hypothetical protein
MTQFPLKQRPLEQQTDNTFKHVLFTNAHALYLNTLTFSFLIFTLTMFESRCVFASDNTPNITQHLYSPYQDLCATQQIRSADQQTFLLTPTTEQKDPLRTLQTERQSYAHALIASATIGSLNALGCCLLERYIPVWWPINVVVARISCSLLLPSIVYAYLAFAEGHGITCHCSTMHTSAVIADWTTYLAIKKYH